MANQNISVKVKAEQNKKKRSYRTGKIRLKRINILFWKVKYKDKYNKLHYHRNQKQQRLSEGKKKKDVSSGLTEDLKKV